MRRAHLKNFLKVLVRERSDGCHGNHDSPWALTSRRGNTPGIDDASHARHGYSQACFLLARCQWLQPERSCTLPGKQNHEHDQVLSCYSSRNGTTTEPASSVSGVTTR
jgi:hypothetical protein